MTNDVLRELETWLRDEARQHREAAALYPIKAPRRTMYDEQAAEFERRADALCAFIREREPEK